MVSDARAQNSEWMVSKNYGCHPLDEGLSADAQAVGVVPICSNSPGRRLADDDDVDDDSDSDDDDGDGDDEHGTQAMQATPTGQLSYCIFHPQCPTIRLLITFVILVLFAQALLSGSQ